MIDFLRGWITNIAVIIIFIAALEILMPHNDTKRFVKVVAGLLIILVMVTPFVNLTSLQNQLKDQMSFSMSHLEAHPVKEEGKKNSGLSEN